MLLEILGLQTIASFLLGLSNFTKMKEGCFVQPCTPTPKAMMPIKNRMLHKNTAGLPPSCAKPFLIVIFSQVWRAKSAHFATPDRKKCSRCHPDRSEGSAFRHCGSPLRSEAGEGDIALGIREAVCLGATGFQERGHFVFGDFLFLHGFVELPGYCLLYGLSGAP
ncbi:MAG: hypothetical protein WB680_19000 [Candidatus Acidiferrales bacterium]